MSSETTDRTVEEFRTRITELDREIVAAVNRRIELVRELHAYKGEQGIAVRDLERERRLVELLAESNEGLLSRGGLERLVEFVLALVREENAR